jgi:hypothetical protein
MHELPRRDAGLARLVMFAVAADVLLALGLWHVLTGGDLRMPALWGGPAAQVAQIAPTLPVADIFPEERPPSRLILAGEDEQGRALGQMLGIDNPFVAIPSARFHSDHIVRFPDAFDVRFPEPNPLPEMIGSAGSEQLLYFSIQSTFDSLLQREQFGELDRLATLLRQPRAASPAGYDMLSAMFDMYAAKDPNQTEASFERLQSLVRAYRQAYPETSTPYMIEALLLYRKAWRARGGETEWLSVERQIAFKAALAELRAYMDQHAGQLGKEPFALVLEVRLAGESRDGADAVLDVVEHGMKAFPGYSGAYMEALNFLPARPGDKSPAYVQMARTLSLNADDPLRRTAYFRVLWGHAKVQGFDLSGVAAIDRDLLRASMLEFLSAYPDNQNVKNVALFACANGDLEVAKLALHRLQAFPIDKAAWDPWGKSGKIPYQVCREKVFEQLKWDPNDPAGVR